VTPTPDSLTHLRLALDALADALLTGRPDDVLAVEATLGHAVAAFQRDDSLRVAPAGELRRSLFDLQLRLRRCERLGRALTDLTPPASAAGYGPSGRPRSSAEPAANAERRAASDLRTPNVERRTANVGSN
jgi:hypothetical protein